MRKIVSLVFLVLLSIVLVSCSTGPNATRYDVKFYADDVLIKSEKVIEGRAATAPNVPDKEGYDFVGWDKEFDKVESDLIINAVYEIKTYTVTFKDGETILKSETVNHGGSASAPTVESIPGKIFTGWDKEFNLVTSDLEVNALFDDATSFEVSFYDGEVLIEKVTVEFGSAAVAPNSPTKVGYTFVGWDKEFTNVTSDLIVSAIYEKNIYKVTFLDGETELLVIDVEHGNDAVAPNPPTKVGYTFVGWDKEFTNITSNLTVNAVYEKNVYTVTFKDGDTVVDVQEVEHGDDAVAPNPPTKVGYTFVGWDKELTNITSDLIVTSIYEVITYEVKFYHEDTLLETVTVEHGKAATAPNPPTVPGFHFVEWSIDFSQVTSDLDVYAIYEENGPVVSVVTDVNDPNAWTGYSTVTENILVKQGVFGLQFRLKSMNDGVEYITNVDGSTLEGDTLVFYVKGNNNIQLFIRFYYADFSNTQYMINPTIEGDIVEIPLSSFPGLRLSEVTMFGFFAQEWSIPYQWMFIEMDNVAIVDQKGLVKYHEDNVYNPYIALLGSTSDTSLWIATGGVEPKVEVFEDGINLVYRTDNNGSEFMTEVTQDELRGETLMFVMRGLPGAEIFVRFYRADGSYEHILINGDNDGKIVELPLTLFNNIDMTTVTKFGFFIQYWGAYLYTDSAIFIKDIAVVDHLGRLAYLEAHQAPVNDVILSSNNNAESWITSNSENEAFAEVLNGDEALVFRFVSSFNGSEYKLSVADLDLSGNTLSFYAKGNPNTEIFVRFYYSDGSYVHIMVKPTADGSTIELSLAQFENLSLSSVTHFGFFIQDWTTGFGWSEITMKDMKLITK